MAKRDGTLDVWINKSFFNNTYHVCLNTMPTNVHDAN